MIQNVGHAFKVSAAAIFLAMAATWVEKSLITLRYKQVEELCVLIDSLFDAGAGEEYLRAGAGAQTSATQATQIKDALVADLKEILAEITHQQISSVCRPQPAVVGIHGDLFGKPEGAHHADFRGGRTGVRQPGRRGKPHAHRRTVQLSSQMQEMFGGQWKGMNEVLLKTSESIQAAAGKFDQLAAHMQDASQGAVAQMAERMETLVGAIEARQEAMNGRLRFRRSDSPVRGRFAGRVG